MKARELLGVFAMFDVEISIPPNPELGMACSDPQPMYILKMK